MKNILVIDDEKDICSTIADILRDEGYQVDTANNQQQAWECLKQRSYHLVFMDIWMPDGDGIALLNELKNNRLTNAIPVVMISGHGTIETAVESTRLGAHDFIEKPLSMDKLLRTVKNIETIKQNTLKEQPNQFIGKSAIAQKICQQLSTDVKRIAVIGNAGNGKKLCAQIIHQKHYLQSQPIIIKASDINAYQAFGLIENILNSQHGSLIIEDSHNLDKRVEEDLIRINQTEHLIILLSEWQNSFIKNFVHETITIPDLTERKKDIVLIVEHLIAKYAKENDFTIPTLSIGAQNFIVHHLWHQNCNSLKKVVYQIVLLNYQVIERKHLELIIRTHQHSSDDESWFCGDLRQMRDRFEKKYLQFHLEKLDGNISALARVSGMERTSLHRKLKQLEITGKDLS